MFGTCRPPGIYKDDYIDELFKYHHERRCSLHLRHGAVSWLLSHGKHVRHICHVQTVCAECSHVAGLERGPWFS